MTSEAPRHIPPAAKLSLPAPGPPSSSSPQIFSVTISSTLLSCRTKAVTDSGTNNRCHLPNPHITQLALKAKQTTTDSGTYLYLAVLDDGCADAALLLRPQPWLGSRAHPGSNRGPDVARYRAPATDRVRNCRSCKRGMQWEAMGKVQDAGWVAGVTCKIATMALKIPVEAPGFRCSSSCSQKCRIGRSGGTAAIQADSWMTPISSIGASHGSCRRAIESSVTTIIN